MSGLDEELRRVHAEQKAAMEGLSGEAAVEAGLRAALEHAVANVDPDLANLEHALGTKFDAGAFFMGMQTATMLMQRMSILEVARSPLGGRLFSEYIARMREVHKDV